MMMLVFNLNVNIIWELENVNFKPEKVCWISIMKLSRVAILPYHFLPKKDLLVGIVWGGAGKQVGGAIQTPGTSILDWNFSDIILNKN